MIRLRMAAFAITVSAAVGLVVGIWAGLGR